MPEYWTLLTPEHISGSVLTSPEEVTGGDGLAGLEEVSPAKNLRYAAVREESTLMTAVFEWEGGATKSTSFPSDELVCVLEGTSRFTNPDGTPLLTPIVRVSCVLGPFLVVAEKELHSPALGPETLRLEGRWSDDEQGRLVGPEGGITTETLRAIPMQEIRAERVVHGDDRALTPRCPASGHERGELFTRVSRSLSET